MHIRPFKSNDTHQVARLFHETIREVNLTDYSEEQVRAWAPDDIHFKDWETHCLSKHTIVADDEGTIAGFAQLEDDGYIDCFYCHKAYQRQGVGSTLYAVLEEKAKRWDLKQLSTEASITAKPFFESRGFIIIRSKLVLTRGQKLKNYSMEKLLE